MKRKERQLALVDGVIVPTRRRPRADGLCAACDGQSGACPRCDEGCNVCDLGHEHDCDACDGSGIAACATCDSTGHADATAMITRAVWTGAPEKVKAAVLAANVHCTAGYPQFKASGAVIVAGAMPRAIASRLTKAGFSHFSDREWAWSCKAPSLPKADRDRLTREVESIKAARKSVAS